MQDRLGPNRVGPAGLLQAVADGVKMFTKEDITPRAADRYVHLLAPLVATAPVMLLFAVVPWGRGFETADTQCRPAVRDGDLLGLGGRPDDGRLGLEQQVRAAWRDARGGADGLL